MQIDRTRFITITFDAQDVPDGRQVEGLFAGLRKLAAGVAVSHGGFLRAPYNTRPFKEQAVAAVRTFLRKSSLVEVVAFADTFEPGLGQGGFAPLETKILEGLSSLLNLAAKNGEPFLLLLDDFMHSRLAAAAAMEPQPPTAVVPAADPYFTQSPGEGIWRPLFYSPE